MVLIEIIFMLSSGPVALFDFKCPNKIAGKAKVQVDMFCNRKSGTFPSIYLYGDQTKRKEDFVRFSKEAEFEDIQIAIDSALEGSGIIKLQEENKL